MEKITFDQFKTVEIKAGKIISAEKVPETDKLLRLVVDFAEAEPRQIVSGISLYFPDPATLVGTVCMFVTNLEPRTIKGLESNGMILALGGGEEPFSLIKPDASIAPGTAAK